MRRGSSIDGTKRVQFATADLPFPMPAHPIEDGECHLGTLVVAALVADGPGLAGSLPAISPSRLRRGRWPGGGGEMPRAQGSTQRTRAATLDAGTHTGCRVLVMW